MALSRINYGTLDYLTFKPWFLLTNSIIPFFNFQFCAKRDIPPSFYLNSLCLQVSQPFLYLPRYLPRYLPYTSLDTSLDTSLSRLNWKLKINFVDFCHDSAKLMLPFLALAAPKVHLSSLIFHLSSLISTCWEWTCLSLWARTSLSGSEWRVQCFLTEISRFVNRFLRVMRGRNLEIAKYGCTFVLQGRSVEGRIREVWREV